MMNDALRKEFMRAARSKPAAPVRNKLQFSLRTFLVFVVVSSLGFAWLGVRLQRAMNNRHMIANSQTLNAEIRKLGGSVTVDLQPADWFGRLIDDPGESYIASVKAASPRDFAKRWSKLSDQQMGHFQLSLRIKELNLRGTQVRDAGLEHIAGLTNLQTLHLRNTEVSGRGLDHLQGMTHLKSLTLKGTRVTGDGIQKLQRALPHCVIGR